MSNKKRRMDRQMRQTVRAALGAGHVHSMEAVMQNAVMHRRAVDMSGRPNVNDWVPMTPAELAAMESSAKADNPRRGKLPTWGENGVMAVYGADGAEAVCRRQCRVKSDTRFPYLQSPVGPI